MKNDCHTLHDTLAEHRKLERSYLAHNAKLHSDPALDYMAKAIGAPITVTREDRLEAAMIEVAMCLREGAPSLALMVAEGAMRK